MTLQELLLKNPTLKFRNNLYYQRSITAPTPFERNYVELRKKENRLYSDDVVKELPEFNATPALKKEWQSRKISLKKMLEYLKSKGDVKRILELGCGNGWLSHQLATSLDAEICAMDLNETELKQGAKIFGDRSNLTFVYGDIFTVSLTTPPFDIIALASSIQYFPDIKKLFGRIFELLTPSGEIHIIDSPLYKSLRKSQEARKRSQAYFGALGNSSMVDNYFHHTFSEMGNFNFKVLSKPHSIASIFRRRILGAAYPVFPWIVISRD